MKLGRSNEQIEVQAHSLNDGDVIVGVHATIRDFSGRTEAIVVGHDWLGFLTELSTLNDRRQGQATLRSTGTAEINLRLLATDRAGHLAFEGELLDRTGAEEETLSLRFGPIAFDPSALQAMLEEFKFLAPAV